MWEQILILSLMFQCRFQLVLRFLQCLEWPKAHTQPMAKNPVPAFYFNALVSLSFQPAHAITFSHSCCSSTITSVQLVMLCFCVLIVPLFQIPRSSPMALSRHPSVADVWVPLSHRVSGRVQPPSTDKTFFFMFVFCFVFCFCALHSLILFFSLCLHRLSREETWEASYRANTLYPGLSPNVLC